MIDWVRGAVSQFECTDGLRPVLLAKTECRYTGFLLSIYVPRSAL